MTTAADIIEYVDEIVASAVPRRVILFGSYAYGEPNYDSDVDLLVITDSKKRPTDQAVAIRLACSVRFPVDLIVNRQAVIDRRVEQNDWFLREVMTKGLRLYDADDKRVGAEGRRRLRRRLAAASLAKAQSI